MDSMTKAFFFGLTDELEKRAACTCGKKDCPGGKECPKSDKGKDEKKEGKKGFVFGKKAMDDGAGSPTAAGSSIRAKIQAARRDPSTKANPKDTGPKGSGLQDPRAQAMKGRGFGKSAEELGKEAWGGGLAKAKELNKHIQAAGGNVQAGVKAYNEAKKGGKKPMKKKATAEEAFFAGFDEALGKDAATAVAGPRGSGERKNVAGMLRSMRGIPRKPKAASKLRAALQKAKGK